MKIASRNYLLLRHTVKTFKLKKELSFLIRYYIMRAVSDGKKNEMKWNEMKGNEINEMKWNEISPNKRKWN